MIKKSKSQKLIFEKTITRDWPLFIVENLHNGLTKEFKKRFNFSCYSEVLIDCYPGRIDIYRAPIEHIDKMRDFILRKLKANPYFFISCAKELLNLYFKFEKVVKEIDSKNLRSLENKELKKLLGAFFEVHRKVEPTFVINLFFPIHMEDHPKRKKYKKEFEVAIKVRAKTDGFGPEGDRVATKFAREISRRIFAHTKYAKVLSLKEAHEFLSEGKIPDEKELKKRRQGFVYGAKGIDYVSLKKYAASEGHEIRELKLKDEPTKIIKGMSAFQGIVQGEAHLILSKTKIHLLKRGEILVTAMTTPEFVPAMKMSSAIITDEGGITCHAAIISRELGIPCIIGTKIATQVLRDGDKVEVDANKGIIKILQKSKNKVK